MTGITRHDEPVLPNFTKTTLTKIVSGEISKIHEYERLPSPQPDKVHTANETGHPSREAFPSALAFVWLCCSNLRTKEHPKKDGNLLRQTYEPITTDTVTVPPAQLHTQHFVVQKSMPPPFQPRESSMRFVWAKSTTITTEYEEGSKTQS